METHTTLRLKNQFCELEHLHQTLVKFGRSQDIPSNALEAMNLALEELIVNIISYAFSGHAEHTIILRLFIEDHQMIAEVEDDGNPFNPLDAPDPDVSLALEERPIGGLGILLTKKMVDHLEYLRRDGKNFLRLKKNLPQ